MRRRRSPAFHEATSSRVRVSRFTRFALRSGCQVTLGQSVSFGIGSFATPEPSSVKCACRVAAQLGIIAIGFDTACVG